MHNDAFRMTARVAAHACAACLILALSPLGGVRLAWATEDTPVSPAALSGEVVLDEEGANDDEAIAVEPTPAPEAEGLVEPAGDLDDCGVGEGPTDSDAATDGPEQEATDEAETQASDVVEAAFPDDQQEQPTDAAEQTVAEQPAGEPQPSESPDVDPEPLAAQPTTKRNGWVRELDEHGLAWRYYRDDVMQTGWLVTGTNPLGQGTGLQRYWLDSTGAMALNRLIDPTTELDANAWYAFSTTSGAVVRGKYRSDTGYVYLANNEGKLANVGWVVSNAYGDGLQRYYVDPTLHAAVPGYATSGWRHYTCAAGYVARGRFVDPDTGYVYLANGDGRLEADGWLVSNAYGQGLQRYYIEPSAHAAVPGFSRGGYAHYTLPAGYVLRGARNESGVLRVANNDGLVTEGWLVTSAFGQGVQRYWQHDGQILRDQLVKTGTSSYSFARPDGYVVRGKWVHPATGRVYLADGDGKLASAGWLVTKAYDGKLERYYVDGTTHAARTGFFNVGGKGYFGLPTKGYVARANNSSVKSDNDGVLTYPAGWLVTDAFGQGLQRYWVRGGTPVTSQLVRLASGAWAYARPEGYVVRGLWADNATGSVYLANNDGTLEKPGWVTSKAYDAQGITRKYWVDSKTHAAVTGEFSVDGNRYLGLRGKGFVLVGYAMVDDVAYNGDATGALYPTLTATAKVAQGVETTLLSTVAGGMVYLFLPSSADTTDISLSAALGSEKAQLMLGAKGSSQFVTADRLDLLAWQTQRADNGAWLFDVRTVGSTLVHTLAVMVSSGTKAVYLVSADPESGGRLYIERSLDHSTSADVTVLVVDADGKVVYNKDAEEGGYSTIKGRGNSTWVASVKKPYQIKLSKKEDLLGSGDKANKAKKWLLLANASDPSLLRTTYVMALGRMLGIDVEQLEPVDLYYDGQYRGSYLLVEKVEIGSGRIDIEDLEGSFEDANEGVDLADLPTARATNSAGMTFQYVVGADNPSDISGGYLLEVDPVYYEKEAVWFDTSHGKVVVKSPEFCSYESVLYISEYVQLAFDLFDGYALGTVSGRIVSERLDLDSFVAVSLVQELVRNIDYFHSSTYFYKDAGGCLVAGPLWDFDACCGLRTEDRVGTGFIEDAYADFIGKSRTLVFDLGMLWRREGSNAAWRTLRDLPERRSEIAATQAMNEVIWKFKTFPNERDPLPTYEENFNFLTKWLEEQIGWFDDKFGVA